MARLPGFPKPPTPAVPVGGPGRLGRPLRAPRSREEQLAGLFSGPTCEWLRSTDVRSRKALGQYMTPRALRERLLDQCDLWPGIRVLDPGVGTGEFLASVLERQPAARAYGWDVDTEVLSAARRVAPGAHLEQRSALGSWDGPKFDLVVGNPPYFQFRADSQTKRRFRRVISGRVNIFSLFFQIGIEVLRPGGQLAFVVPPSMNSGAYFNRLRTFLAHQADVEFLEVNSAHDLFDGAHTAVQLIVLRVGSRSSTNRHVMTFHDAQNGFKRTIFCEDADALARRQRRGKTLFQHGYKAATGTIVWNQHRHALRHERNGATVRLIWSHNIGDGLNFATRPRRPPFIETSKMSHGPAIVVNRITGSVGQTELRCALVPDDLPFVAENHVNVIRPHGLFQPLLEWPLLLESLRHPDVVDHARLITGNTQISATELTHMLRV